MKSSKIRRGLRVKDSVSRNNKGSRPRVVVNRSCKNMYVQLVMQNGLVVNCLSTLSSNFDANGKNLSGMQKAKKLGYQFASSCLQKGFKKIVFDKGFYAYGGRVRALAEGCREGGLDF